MVRMAGPSEKFIVPLIIEMVERHGLQGRIVLAGPLTDQVGSLIVIEVRSREEAEEFARQDP